jgi:hypothetical protein
VGNEQLQPHRLCGCRAPGWRRGRLCRLVPDAPCGGRGVKLYNDCDPRAASSSTTEPDIGGGNSALKFVFQQPGNPINPEVTVYRDPVMAHTGFTSSPNRYFDAAAVWEWFKLHPHV